MLQDKPTAIIQFAMKNKKYSPFITSVLSPTLSILSELSSIIHKLFWLQISSAHKK